MAALFDPVELLRPRWPLHAELERLVAQAPARGDARVIAFGADAGALPAALRPDPAFADGPLRLIPFVLRGDAATVAAVGGHFEEVLMETGMAGAATALLAQQGFGAQVEHARYLTMHDLMAMMAFQYEHAGLAALWPLIETALLAPTGSVAGRAARAAGARGRRRAHVALFDDHSWFADASPRPGSTAPRFRARSSVSRCASGRSPRCSRRTACPVSYDHCPTGRAPREMLGD